MIIIQPSIHHLINHLLTINHKSTIKSSTKHSQFLAHEITCLGLTKVWHCGREQLFRQQTQDLLGTDGMPPRGSSVPCWGLVRLVVDGRSSLWVNPWLDLWLDLWLNLWLMMVKLWLIYGQEWFITGIIINNDGWSSVDSCFVMVNSWLRTFHIWLVVYNNAQKKQLTNKQSW